MTPCIRTRLNGNIDVFRRCFASAFLLVSLAPWSSQAISPAATTLKRDSARCLAHGGVDACNDAIRRNPSDPPLLVALADAELHANRPADALRHYRRAADLAPGMNGLNAKISTAEARLHPKRSSIATRHAPKPAPDTALDKQYSNTAPLAESH
jgi:cytochrome c-type biogenesis protein CcmH/NrfG